MLLVLTVILLALVFEYVNGFHDTANSIATVVSTRVLTPNQAVIWAACFELMGGSDWDLELDHGSWGNEAAQRGQVGCS